MNIQLILQLLVLVEEIKTEKELTAHLESLLRGYGFEYYSVLMQPKASQDTTAEVLAGRWPTGWLEVYEDRKYNLVDPTARILGSAHRPFRWRDVIVAMRSDPSQQRMRRMMQEAARYGMLDGYGFPIHGRYGLLGSMSIFGRSVELSPAEIALFDASAKKVFWRYLQLRGQADDLEAVAMDTQLTRREREVMMLLTEGRTSNEIAGVLAISSHTVDWYINGLQEKLKAKNRQHVVASAFRLGLVS